MVRKIESKEEFDKVLAEAGAKCVIVDFTAEWCGPCKMIGPKFAKMAEEFDSIIAVKIDVDECEDVAAEYNVSAMPTFIVIKNKAEQKDSRLMGANEAKLRQLFESFK